MANSKFKLHTGDKVEVIAGKDAGKTGKIERIVTAKGKVLVENINLVKKHMKPKAKQAGGIITLNKPIAISNIMLVCPNCNKKTRIGYTGEGKDKQRVCKKCKAVIEVKAKAAKK